MSKNPEKQEVNYMFVHMQLCQETENITDTFKDQDSCFTEHTFAFLDGICFCTNCWQCDPA